MITKHTLYIYIMLMAVVTVLLSSCATKKTAELKTPTPKSAIVRYDTPYEDHLQYPFDDKGLDLTVKLSFEEATNTLTLCLKGNRQLMVFRQDVVYKTIFRHPFLRKRVLCPTRLPYPVLVRPNMRIMLPKAVYKEYPKKRKMHLFNNWIGRISQELKPIQPSIATDDAPEATLIVDSVVQRFHVDPKATQASFSLRNLLVLNETGDAKSLAQLKRLRNDTKKIRYLIAYDKDLNLIYNIQLQRNPCFGQEAVIDSATTQLSNIKVAFENLKAACPYGSVETKAEQGVFNQHRSYLLDRYTAITDSSRCSDVQSLYNQYNAYRDSIKNAPCLYVPNIETGADGMAIAIKTGVRPDVLLDAAHRIDNIVASLMVARDPAHIHDLTRSGEEIITTINRSVHEKGLINDEQRTAFTAYRRAQLYFSKIILKQ